MKSKDGRVQNVEIDGDKWNGAERPFEMVRATNVTCLEGCYTCPRLATDYTALVCVVFTHAPVRAVRDDVNMRRKTASCGHLFVVLPLLNKKTTKILHKIDIIKQYRYYRMYRNQIYTMHFF